MPQLSLHLYGIFIGLGLTFSYFYCLKQAKTYNLNAKNIDNSFLTAIPLGLLFARIYHVLSMLDYYLSYPAESLYTWNGGLGVFGLIFGVIFGLWISAKTQKIQLINLLNLISPSLLLAQAIGRLGNYFNLEAIAENGFPVFLLESILCLTAFLIFLSIMKLRNYGFAYYLISYGIIRFFTEFLRTDTWKIGSLHIAHIISVFMIIEGVWLFRKKYLLRG